jgi:hypothetical protein
MHPPHPEHHHHPVGHWPQLEPLHGWHRAPQDNGAGAPLHFAVTYCQLDMAHHLVNMGAEVNQRDNRGGWPALPAACTSCLHASGPKLPPSQLTHHPIPGSGRAVNAHSPRAKQA